MRGQVANDDNETGSLPEGAPTHWVYHSSLHYAAKVHEAGCHQCKHGGGKSAERARREIGTPSIPMMTRWRQPWHLSPTAIRFAMSAWAPTATPVAIGGLGDELSTVSQNAR